MRLPAAALSLKMQKLVLFLEFQVQSQFTVFNNYKSDDLKQQIGRHDQSTHP